jgi:hypothetical protein
MNLHGPNVPRSANVHTGLDWRAVHEHDPPKHSYAEMFETCYAFHEHKLAARLASGSLPTRKGTPATRRAAQNSGGRGGYMSEAAFWLDHKAEFENSATRYPGLRAVWFSFDERWRLEGSGATVFVSIARETGAAIASSAADPFHAWLDSLRRHHADNPEYVSEFSSEDLDSRIQISHVFRASAECCREQQSRLLTASLSERGSSEPNRRCERSPTEEKATRAAARSAWLNQRLDIREDWSSDKDIEISGGPTYNTIQRYRSGATSTRELSVRKQFAKACKCDLKDVPQ